MEFTYGTAPLNDMQVVTGENNQGKTTVQGVGIGNEVYQPSQRFWTSLFARFGFNKAFFKFYDYDEVFNRVSEVSGSDRLRYCVEHGTTKKGKPYNRLLAVTNPTKPIVTHDQLLELLDYNEPEETRYHNGIVHSTHLPRATQNFEVAGDLYSNRYSLGTPIDGYGAPNVYLSLLRQVCTNGMVAMARAFKSSISLGRGNDDIGFAITRVLDGFDSEEGYAALRARLEAAAKSWASVYETQALYKALVKMHHNDGVALGDDGAFVESTPFMREMLMRETDDDDDGDGVDAPNHGSSIMRAFHNMTGDASKIYGLANLDALSVKRQRTVPVKCTIYDCINFATEVASHHTQVEEASRDLQAWFGTTVSKEYDLEGTIDRFHDFADFHVESKLENDLTG